MKQIIDLFVPQSSLIMVAYFVLICILRACLDYLMQSRIHIRGRGEK